MLIILQSAHQSNLIVSLIPSPIPSFSMLKTCEGGREGLGTRLLKPYSVCIL